MYFTGDQFFCLTKYMILIASAQLQADLPLKVYTILVLTIKLAIVNEELFCFRILVMDQGRIAEFDTPANLLKDKTGIFYSMAQNAGVIQNIFQTTNNELWASLQNQSCSKFLHGAVGAVLKKHKALHNKCS